MSVPYEIITFNESETRPEHDALQDIAELETHFISLLGWRWNRGMSLPYQNPKDYLFVFLLNGELSGHINQSTYLAKETSLLCLPKNTLCEMTATKDSEFIALHADFFFIDAQTRYELTVKNNIFNDSHAHKFGTQLKHIIKLFHSDDSTLSQTCLLFLKHWVFHMLQETQLEKSAAIQRDDLIESCLQKIHADCSLNVEELEKYSGLGSTQFRKRFKNHTNVNPSQYISRLRADLAAQLLRENTISLHDISRACHYENPNYLFRAFRKFYHCTPNEYRQRGLPEV